MDTIAIYEKSQIKRELPDLLPGDTVRVHSLIKEGDKERIQVFEGTVIKIQKRSLRSTFTVRKVSYGVGVERVFPFYTPSITQIDVMRHGQVSRAKLYYLRGLKGKAARIREDKGNEE